ncbi:MAG: DUF3857 domain-containing protein [Terricaulis sp.]
MDQAVSVEPGQIAHGVTRAPAPAWADVSPYARPEKPNPHFVAGGICTLLDDTQVDLTGPDRAWFSRHADLVLAGVGAERVARFDAVFDPNYERIEVHFIRVLRGAESIDHTLSTGFEVMRRERDLEQLKFDGRLSVHLTIPDVRVGDVVEFAYTTYGMRPLLGDRHACWIGFEWPHGVVDVRHRLRRPATRAVGVHAVNNPPAPTLHEADGVVTQTWRAVERENFKGEPLAPPWLLQRAEVQFSEWRDWAEVAAVFAPGYVEESALPAEVETEIARIAALPSQAEQAAAALLFVQRSIRYLAIAMGDGGFVPRPLGEIWTTRYGDCKDKVKLYVAIARRLGLDACPALVNTREGEGLDQWLPSGLAFDHCIVRANVGGKIYWLDPTCAPQPSDLDYISQSCFGWALPLKPGADALEAMGAEVYRHNLECNEWIHLGESPDAPVRYEWRVTSRGWRAEELRTRFAREGEVGLFKMYAEDLQRAWPKAKAVKQEIMRDDVAKNEIATIEDYTLSDVWANQGDARFSFDTMDFFIRAIFFKLDPGPRKHPIYLGHVGKLTRKVEVQTAVPWTVTPWKRRINASVLTYEAELRQTSTHMFEMTHSLDIRAWTLPAEEAEKYREIVAQLEMSDLRLANQVSGGKFVGSLKEGESTSLWTLIRWLIPAGLIIAALVRYGAQ